MTVSLLGFAWDASSSHARGAALGPSIIKALLGSDISNDYSISGVGLSDIVGARAFPDLPEDAAAARDAIATHVAQALKAGMKPLSLGGDHSITLPILRAMHAAHGRMNVLHIDAHTDLYDELCGDRYSHACPFRRAIEEGLIGTLVQVGIRAARPEHLDFGRAHGVIILGADEIEAVPFARLSAPLYVSIDLDGLDPAYAPGVSHPEPGGLSTREVLSILKKLPTAPVGADIVELNPEKDMNLLTAHVAVRLVKELAALMG
ncbi:MAG: arginase family protein [Hyphomonadaceae bacterium]|nr:arginase family protein [Hyphomonadaceae bacterium]